MKKSLSFLSFLIILILFLSVVQVAVSSKLSTTGVELGNIQDEVVKYKKENFLLNEKLLLSSSFTTIASSASEIGFVEQKSKVYLTTPLPMALKR